MGGFGSGPRGGGRLNVEACRSLDVNRLHRDGCLEPGWSGSVSWHQDEERVAWIRMRAEENRLVLNYRFRRNDEEWQDVDEPISIIRVPCRYGGSRPYFICPGVVNGRYCGRRVVKLYEPGRYFLCRHCYRLAYASQSEDAMDRARRRAPRSVSGWVAGPICPSSSHQSPRACGTAPMSVSATRRSRPMKRLTPPSSSWLPGSWRVCRVALMKGSPGYDGSSKIDDADGRK